MGLSDKKLETAIIGFSIVMIASMGYVLKAPVQTALAGADIVYEMPRPKMSFLASLFNLGDREVDRKYVNPFAKKKAEEKKVAEAKKAEAAKAAAKAVVKAVAKKAEDARKSKVDVQVVGAKETKTWGDDGFFGNGGGPTNTSNVAGGDSDTTAKAKDKDKDKKTAQEWIALLTSQPTAENVSKLIAAYSKQEVDAETYYQVMAELYKSNRSDTQAMGLVLAKSVYSAKSFTLTFQAEVQFPDELKSKAQEYLNSYGVSGRLGSLATVLQGADTDAAVMAANIVLAGYQKAKNGTTVPASDPRSTRGDVVTNSVSGYTQFIAIFEKLTSSNDAELASLANSALSQIQNPVASL